MRHLNNHVLFVGPDRSYKTTMIRAIRAYVANESYKGARGDDATIGKMMLEPPYYLFDRALLCDRAYNMLYGRDVPDAICRDKFNAEWATRQSKAPYVFMTRHSFEGVRDDVHPENDLPRLSAIYRTLLDNVGVPVLTLYVDDVTRADHNDAVWLDMVDRVLSFIDENA